MTCYGDSSVNKVKQSKDTWISYYWETKKLKTFKYFWISDKFCIYNEIGNISIIQINYT